MRPFCTCCFVMKRWAWIVVISLGIGAIGCGGTVGGKDGGDAGDSGSASSLDVHSYTLRASYDWDSGVLTASEDITLTLPADAGNSVKLDSQVAISKVTSASGALTYTVDDDAGTMTIDLAPAMKSGSQVTFTIDYKTDPAAVNRSRHQDDDPVLTRMAFTHNEPELARDWLVSNDRPDDRATFAIELTVPAGEDVISNGKRVSDVTDGGSRTVGYRIDKPIPTYLMAFAFGQLVHADSSGGRVPLSVWYRKGLAVDTNAVLAEMARQQAVFEPLVGPYPWDSYALVLAQDFLAGGEENVGISFVQEYASVPSRARGLTAHEFAHQWFGDWVTVATWDDLWIKEGMATLMAAEASRSLRDQQDAGRLFGGDLVFEATDAIITAASSQKTSIPTGLTNALRGC